MKIKVSNLQGAALDWAVSQCEGKSYKFMASTGGDYNGNWWWETRKYSCLWRQGGEIVEREQISICWEGSTWYASLFDPGISSYYSRQYGSTPLIAAMRCYVASNFGEEVEVPDEILG